MEAVVLFGILISAALYLLPSIVAITRKRQLASVLVINIFLGWTIIGWVGALALAVSSETRSQPPSVIYPPTYPPAYHPGPAGNLPPNQPPNQPPNLYHPPQHPQPPPAGHTSPQAPDPAQENAWGSKPSSPPGGGTGGHPPTGPGAPPPLF